MENVLESDHRRLLRASISSISAFSMRICAAKYSVRFASASSMVGSHSGRAFSVANAVSVGVTAVSLSMSSKSIRASRAASKPFSASTRTSSRSATSRSAS